MKFPFSAVENSQSVLGLADIGLPALHACAGFAAGIFLPRLLRPEIAVFFLWVLETGGWEKSFHRVKLS